MCAEARVDQVPDGCLGPETTLEERAKDGMHEVSDQQSSVSDSQRKSGA